MILIKKLINSAAALALLALASISPEASAQTSDKNPKLEKHESQRMELLAAQRPLSADIMLPNYTKFVDGLRANDLLDNEVFDEYWESQLVNPYAGASIPDMKDIDVSSYVSPMENMRITSPFGYRPRFRRMHKGMDFGLHVGDTIRAAFDGKVRICRYERKGYGYYVVIRHDNGMETVYGHLSKFICKPDDRVRAGDPIALGGNTGRSTGPHLHFETRFMGIAINPALIIDFENKVPLNGTFTFNRSIHEKQQKFVPAKKKRRVATNKRRSRRRR
ncbi:MAG: M23 family metallopeptidase [Pseudoflavonifractor sp.]|nr:M23 family metallopeptidase [Alloprevotella sp.]MCM1116826.1 M23 family metallopeptidase [Pseudoflavonifractor sp.]